MHLHWCHHTHEAGRLSTASQEQGPECQGAAASTTYPHTLKVKTAFGRVAPKRHWVNQMLLGLKRSQVLRALLSNTRPEKPLGMLPPLAKT